MRAPVLCCAHLGQAVVEPHGPVGPVEGPHQAQVVLNALAEEGPVHLPPAYLHILALIVPARVDSSKEREGDNLLVAAPRPGILRAGGRLQGRLGSWPGPRGRSGGGFRSQESGVRSQESGVRSQNQGVRKLRIVWPSLPVWQGPVAGAPGERKGVEGAMLAVRVLVPVTDGAQEEEEEEHHQGKTLRKLHPL